MTAERAGERNIQTPLDKENYNSSYDKKQLFPDFCKQTPPVTFKNRYYLLQKSQTFIAPLREIM